eukprot:scaffold419537_cov41-Prasinocladus_malaysianus.AAC.1
MTTLRMGLLSPARQQSGAGPSGRVALSPVASNLQGGRQLQSGQARLAHSYSYAACTRGLRCRTYTRGCRAALNRAATTPSPPKNLGSDESSSDEKPVML